MRRSIRAIAATALAVAVAACALAVAAHLGWRGRTDSDALDRWLTAVAGQGRAG